jgi:SAM-dependent methyltransferase
MRLYNGEALITARPCAEETVPTSFPGWKMSEHAFLLDRVGEIGVRDGTLLDVGCFSGMFLMNAKGRGFDVAGVEPNRDAFVYVRDKLGYEVVHGSVESAGFPPERFSVLSYLDVIEHMPEPLEELRRAHGLLRPGGVLVLTTPSVTGLPQRIAKLKRAVKRQPWCPIDDVPWHLWGFSRTSLSYCVKKAGLAVRNITWLDPSPLTTNLGAGSSRVKRLGLLAVAHVSKWVRMSDRMALFAQKPN